MDCQIHTDYTTMWHVIIGVYTKTNGQWTYGYVHQGMYPRETTGPILRSLFTEIFLAVKSEIDAGTTHFHLFDVNLNQWRLIRNTGELEGTG